MFFLMGFLVAGLIALMFLPVLARRAMRLSEARARLRAPLSQQQALAELDQLRAEHAVDRRRLEQRMAILEDSVAVHRADLGRRATTIMRLEDVGAERLAEIAAQLSELAQKREEIRSLEADLAGAKIVLYDFAGQIERAKAEIAEMRDHRIELETISDKKRTIVAGLETRASGLEIELDDSRRDSQAAARAARIEQTRLARALAAEQDEAKRLSASLGEAMAKGAILVAEVESKSRQLHEAQASLAKAEALLARSERAREDALIESARLLSVIGERGKTAADVEARADEDVAALAAERLSTGRSPMEGAMRALRGQRAVMQREIEHLRRRLAAADNGPQGDTPLRQAISRLALDVARLSAPSVEETPAPSNLLSFELREPSLPFEYSDDGSKGSTIIKLRQMQPRAPDR